MNCPECQSSKLNIYDSRHIGDHVVRKRKCMACDERFYTIESYMSAEELEAIEAIRREQHDTGSETQETSEENIG
jgi:transcriptional regulator NrdR family protein